MWQYPVKLQLILLVLELPVQHERRPMQQINLDLAVALPVVLGARVDRSINSVFIYGIA